MVENEWDKIEGEQRDRSGITLTREEVDGPGRMNDVTLIRSALTNI